MQWMHVSCMLSDFRWISLTGKADPPQQKNGRSLTLEATPHRPPPDALIRRVENEPWYKFCKRASILHCFFDANCFAIKYVATPLGVILFGIMQIENGLHFGPGYLVPPILILACQKLLNAMDACELHVILFQVELADWDKPTLQSQRTAVP